MRWRKPQGGSHKCAGKLCTNNTKVNADLVFYRFPADRERAEKWISLLKNEELRGLTQKTLRNRRVCEKHFEKKCFLNPNFKSRGLVWDAKPTLFLEVTAVVEHQYSLSAKVLGEMPVPSVHVADVRSAPLTQQAMVDAGSNPVSADTLKRNGSLAVLEHHHSTSAAVLQAMPVPSVHVADVRSAPLTQQAVVDTGSNPASADTLKTYGSLAVLANHHSSSAAVLEAMPVLSAHDADFLQLTQEAFVDPGSNPVSTDILKNNEHSSAELVEAVIPSTSDKPGQRGAEISFPETGKIQSSQSVAVPAENSVPPLVVTKSKKGSTKKPRNFKELPKLPRIPRGEKTPLVSSLLKSNYLVRTRHVKLRRRYLEKCRRLHLYKIRRDQVALEYCKERLSPQFYQLLCCQLRNALRKPRGYRYTEEDLALFLDWYERAPKLYRAMGMIRPDKVTLRKLLRGLSISPGVNDAVMAALTHRVQSLPEDQTHVSLLMDGISIKHGLVYNQRLDKMIGLVHLSNGEMRFELAEEALVFLVRSIYGTWKQAVGFYFVNGKCTGADYSGAVVEILDALQKTGLRVRVLINDGLSKNKTALDYLGATYEQPWFNFNNETIFTFYDYVHCFKNMRNNLMIYLLKLTNGKIVNFQFIIDFVEHDMLQPYRLAPKLTRAHIQPSSFQKQRVPLATQLFSGHTAAGISTYALMTDILPQEALATANFVGDMNDLFDSLNGTKVIKEKPLKSVVTKGSPHLALWERWANEMAGWEFIGSKHIAFDKQWASTLKAAIMFARSVLEGEERPQLPMGHLNQDPIENYFSGIREKGGNRPNPDPAEFQAAYSTSLINSLTYQNKGKNCSNDDGVSLLHLQELLRKAKEIQKQTADGAQDIVAVDEEQHEDEEALVEEEGLVPEDAPGTSGGPGPALSITAPEGLEGAGLSSEANSIVMSFLQQIKCVPCSDILLEECSFPRHFNSMMLSGSDSSGKYSSAIVATALKDITEEGCKSLSDIWTQGNGVLSKFVKVITHLPSVQLLQLCPEHSALKVQLLKLFAKAAIRTNMKWALAQLKQPKKPSKKCQKAKNMQHC